MRRLAPSFSFSFAEGVRVSQEWDEVVHEVDLMIERLEAFEHDLLAAVAGGKLTDRQREFARNSTVLTSGCALCLSVAASIILDVEASSVKAEEGDTKK